eukprot:4038157-Amphidinium_carterae.1
MIDCGTHLHVAKRLPDREASSALEAFVSAWATPLGLPLEFHCDYDPTFRGKFADHLESLGVLVHYCSPNDHWQIGQIERHNHVLREMVERVVDQEAVVDPQGLDILSCTNAKNTLSRRAGLAPFTAVFGRTPRLPAELLSDQGDPGSWFNMTQDEVLARAQQLRCAALRAFADTEQSTTLRTAVLRQLPKKSCEFLPGQKVAFWRSRALPRHGGRGRRGGFQIGTFLAYDGGVEKCRGKCMGASCGPSWLPDRQQWESVLKGERAIAANDVVDVSEPAPVGESELRTNVPTEIVSDRSLHVELPTLAESESDPERSPSYSMIDTPPASSMSGVSSDVLDEIFGDVSVEASDQPQASSSTRRPLEAIEELVGSGSHKFPRLSDVVYHVLVADAGTIQLQIPDGWDGGVDRLARHAGGTYHPGLNE